ncbi:MAG: Rrf2 family transcriptional regulator [Chitinophagaceae bacterium]|nr:Rrf2 family transcriptional regulator [Chitinophagaceae bacterium]
MFSKSCEYAIKASIYLAQQREIGKYIGVKEIAKGIQAPEFFVAKILQELSRKKIILSVKGPNGGFSMTDAQMNKPIIDIVQLIDGDGLLNNCVLGLDQCSNIHPCPMHNEYLKIKQSLKNMLEKNTILDFNIMVSNKKAILFLP